MCVGLACVAISCLDVLLAEVLVMLFLLDSARVKVIEYYDCMIDWCTTVLFFSHSECGYVLKFGFNV